MGMPGTPLLLQRRKGLLGEGKWPVALCNPKDARLLTTIQVVPGTFAILPSALTNHITSVSSFQGQGPPLCVLCATGSGGLPGGLLVCCCTHVA